MATASICLIYGERFTPDVPAEHRGSALWLSREDLERATGWRLQAEGFCKGEVCVPVPSGRAAEFAAGGSFNLLALAGLLGQPVVADEEHRAWCFGEAAEVRTRKLRSLTAPDFRLPDLAGKMHSLSDYRGKKVLLVSWASW